MYLREGADHLKGRNQAKIKESGGGGNDTHFPQTLKVASRSRMVITLGSCTFTSYLGNTGAGESGLSTRLRPGAGF